MNTNSRLLCLVTAALLCACGADLDNDSESSSGILVLREASQQRVAGSFERGGATVLFVTTRSGAATHMEVKGADGAALATSDSDGVTSSLRLLGGRLTYSGPAAGGDGAPAMQMSGDGAALGELLARPEAQGLPWLSQALGAHGVSGRSHPASFALHGFAHFVATNLQLDLPPLSPRMSAEADSAAQAAGCRDLRRDPYRNGCYGMCGKGCGCWSWVCGDCCWHKGCANHDAACRSCGVRNPGACAACASFSAFYTGGGC